MAARAARPGPRSSACRPRDLGGRLPATVIAAVQRLLHRGRCRPDAACDVRLASADAIFSVREAKVAIVADLGSLQRLPGIIGRGHLAELAFTGKDITAARAESIGLVNQVSPDPDSVLPTPGPWPRRSRPTHHSPVQHQGRAGSRPRAFGGRGLEFVAAWNAGFLASDDLVEAMTAFMEKRSAVFTGR